MARKKAYNPGPAELGLTGAGKGSRSRTVPTDNYRDNFDAIFRKRSYESVPPGERSFLSKAELTALAEKCSHTLVLNGACAFCGSDWRYEN